MSITDSNDTNTIMFHVDVLCTHILSYISFILCILVIIYNFYYLKQNPTLKTPKLFITFQLFFMCSFYYLTFIIPLTVVDSSPFKNPYYISFHLNSPNSPSRFFCPLQAIILSSSLLGMLSLNLCIAISSYFTFFKTSLSKYTEIGLCLSSWAIPIIISCCSLFGGGEGRYSMDVEVNLVCWPSSALWRFVYDLVYVVVYFVNLVLIVVIVIKLKMQKGQESEDKTSIYKMFFLGSVLLTLCIHTFDFIHSLIANFSYLVWPQKQEEEGNSNIVNMVFVFIRNVLEMFTWVGLMFVYKPKIPDVMSCDEEKRTNESIVNELLDM